MVPRKERRIEGGLTSHGHASSFCNTVFVTKPPPVVRRCQLYCDVGLSPGSFEERPRRRKELTEHVTVLMRALGSSVWEVPYHAVPALRSLRAVARSREGLEGSRRIDSVENEYTRLVQILEVIRCSFWILRQAFLGGIVGCAHEPQRRAASVPQKASAEAEVSIAKHYHVVAFRCIVASGLSDNIVAWTRLLSPFLVINHIYFDVRGKWLWFW
mmetsp:Transcript_17382/g.34350  ORF Transcript_17382/g.34350 Transcript_17382/m.34350 type:complete len:214 (-) Transcript_17382:113-754(-)